jgi:fermentation-respiration switch protein FrsA (DUF1100 family)
MVRLRWRVICLIVVVASVGAACGGGADGPEQGSAPLGPADRPSLVIEERTEDFVDNSRSTDAVGSTPAWPNRSLPTVVLAPAAGQPGAPYPLIVFAHGNGGHARGDHPLLRAWASAGYVVAAPTFPFGAGRAPQGEGGNDYANQPGDMSFVITEMLRLNGDPTSPLRGSIDPRRIGAAGHSLGGSTSLALAGNTCCYDERVKAAIVLAAGELRFGSGQFWTEIRTPLLFVHGDADAVVPYRTSKRAFDYAPPPRFLITIVGGDHSQPFLGGADAQAQVVTHASLDFFDHFLKGVADGLDRLRADGNVDGVARLESEL